MLFIYIYLNHQLVPENSCCLQVTTAPLEGSNGTRLGAYCFLIDILLYYAIVKIDVP